MNAFRQIYLCLNRRRMATCSQISAWYQVNIDTIEPPVDLKRLKRVSEGPEGGWMALSWCRKAGCHFFLMIIIFSKGQLIFNIYLSNSKENILFPTFAGSILIGDTTGLHWVELTRECRLKFRCRFLSLRFRNVVSTLNGFDIHGPCSRNPWSRTW